MHTAAVIVLAAGRIVRADDVAATEAVDPPIVPADAQTKWRYLAVADEDFVAHGCTFATPLCPAAPGWTGTDLFGGATIPPGLENFCAYESPTGDPAVLEGLVTQGCLVRLDADVMAVTPLATPPFEKLVWQPLHDNFMRQAGALPSAAAPTQPLVRLTIVDTQPTQVLDAPGNALHGFSLAKVAEDLICTRVGTRCGVDIRTRLALAYVKFCSGCTSVDGGYFGTIGDLARAIRLEVADWEVANSGNQETRLVLNLSVGWDPRFGRIGPSGATTVPVLAVQSALQDAVCRGAVAVAAAGNRISGPENTPGPLLPGGWEDRAAPGFQTCVARVEPGRVDPDDFPPGPAYRPLLYGAGAVSFDNSRVVSRTHGEPPRVAFGDHAVGEATIAFESGPTEIQTGTSVAALVAAAAAAASWHYAETKPGYQLMLENYQSGVGLGRTPGYCYPPGPAACAMQVRRVDVCDAVAAICANDPGPLCPPPGSFSCSVPPTQPPSLPFDDIDALFEDGSSPVVDVSTLTQTTGDDACGRNYVLHADPRDVVANACPHLQYYGIQATPWTDGQPSSQPCPTCTGGFHSPGRLYFEIAEEFRGKVTDVTVLCGSNAGYQLPATTMPLAPGERFLVTGIPPACAGSLQVAYRVLDDEGGGDGTVSALTRVLVYQ
jgi:hypothetical protein